jgi:hypothetical protein
MAGRNCTAATTTLTVTTGAKETVMNAVSREVDGWSRQAKLPAKDTGDQVPAVLTRVRDPADVRAQFLRLAVKLRA